MTNHAFSIAALMLTAAILGLPAVAACDNGLDDQCTYPGPDDGPIQSGGTVDCATFAPGDPETGLLPMTEWYVNSNAHAQCELAAAAQNGALRTVGHAGLTAGTLVIETTHLVGDEATPPQEYLDTTQNRAEFLVLSAPSAVGPIATATFNAASTALDTSCVYLTGEVPCI